MSFLSVVGTSAIPVKPDESLVSYVQSLFPQLGAGFISQCLPYFDNDPEKVINALLEDNLPPHLSSLDRELPPQKEITELPDFEANVKPDPEVEIIEDFNLKQLHKGKKNKRKNANDLLNDKSELATIKDRFAELSMVSDEIFIPPEDAEYDDEYDDTYDDNAIGQAEPDAQELGREFVLPRALGGGHIAKAKTGEASDDEDMDENEPSEKLNFARNPAEMRAEAERRWQSKQAHMKKKGYNQPRDVVGNAKGQGQDKSVLINRARKNANKNKMHRAMADKKQSKGMF